MVIKKMNWSERSNWLAKIRETFPNAQMDECPVWVAKEDGHEGYGKTADEACRELDAVIKGG